MWLCLMADKLHELGWAEGHVVLRIDQQSISVELEIESRIGGRFVENDLSGERVWRSPGATRGSQRVCRNGEDAIESVGKQAAAFGPCVCGNSHACLAGVGAYDESRRFRVEIERYGFDAAIVFCKLEPLSGNACGDRRRRRAPREFNFESGEPCFELPSSGRILRQASGFHRREQFVPNKI